MTVTISFASTSDGRIRSSSTNYGTASDGNALDLDTTSTSFGTWGQRLESSTYQLYQYFLAFPYILSSNEMRVSAYFEFYINTNSSGGPSRDLEVGHHNFGTLTTADWRTASQLSGLTLLSRWLNIENYAAGTKVRCGSDELLSLLDSSGDVQVVCFSNRQRAESTASSSEEVTQFNTANASTNSPRMVYTTTPLSTLNRVLGAQVQLSDGTTAYIENDGDLISTTVLKHRNLSGTISTIHTLHTTFTGGPGMQNFALTRDSANNLYVIRRAGDTDNSIAAQAFTKGSGHTWTPNSVMTTAMPNFTGGVINNIVAAWHSAGSGTIVVIASHSAAYNTGISISYLLLNAAALRLSLSSFVRDVDSANEIFYIATSDTFQSNETGTLLDIAAAPGTSDRGYVVTATRNIGLDGVGSPSVARYTLNQSGTGFTSDAQSIGGGLSGAQIKKDGNSKLRVIGISSSTFAVVVADSNTNRGITVCLVQNVGTSTSFNNVANETLGDEGLTTMPSTSAIAVSSAWDAIYDVNTNTIWIYYLDTANSRRLMKTSVDLTTGFSTNNEIQVATNIGASGSTNLAIRAHRGTGVGDEIVISVANRTSGGALSTIYVEDTYNAAPFAPTLTPKTNFNATGAATFAWTFNDPNVGDTQSAFQLEISLAGGAVVHDTGKVVSGVSSRNVTGGTLTNGNSYTWRVRTWDAADLQGSYSASGSFVTSSSGTLNITNPSVDNPAGVITKDNLVEWSVSGTTQAGYRVVVRRNDNDALFLDTGWVTSTDTSFLITNMLSDVEYRIEVTARNASLVETNTAERLLTASFDDPEIPEISLTTNHEGAYIVVAVTNPPPQGSRPVPIRNDIYRAGVDGIFVRVGSAPVDGEMRDYSAGDGIAYQYFARAVTE